ncbi:MAG: YceI family protein [Bdellovibrionales bacterium]|jgi:hypothetical protein|nr:YceI family protein [Bdellovibrionales bacterium]
MKVLITILFFTFLNFTAQSQDCTYSVSPSGVKVEWVAYKTPAKVGVKGSFTKLGFTEAREGKSLEGVMTGAQFNIDTKSTSTGDKGRDMKISSFFFGRQKISGEIVSVDAKKKLIQLEVNMNDQLQKIPLSYQIKKSKVLATGYIDVLDFAMNDSLAKITKACYAKHEGKTWSDVKIILEAKFKKSCKKKS